MKLSFHLIKCLTFIIGYFFLENSVSGYRKPNTYLTHENKHKFNFIKSSQLDDCTFTQTLSADIATTCKEDLLKQTKDWILSKDRDDLASSAHFDGNFNDLFPSRRSTKGGVLLDVRDASIWLGERILFDNVSFSVNTGECVGIVGNNGVGKSSMFDAIYDRLSGVNTKKESMSIMMDVSFNLKEDDVNAKDFSKNLHMYGFVYKLMETENLNPEQLVEMYNNYNSERSEETGLPTHNLTGVGYMRQNYTLDMDHNAVVSDLISGVFESYNMCNNTINFIEKNIYFFNNLLEDESTSKIASDILSLYNNEGKLIKQRFSDMKGLIKKLIKIFGMESVINSKVATLSGGFKMRLYLFLQLLHSPNLLLLDEPTNNLDTTTVKFLTDVLNYLMKNTRLSVLVVSHDVKMLNTMCTSILQMTGDGKIYPYKGNYEDFVLKGTSEKNIKNARIEKLDKNIKILTKEIEELKKSQKGSQKALKVTISQKEQLVSKYEKEMEELVGMPLSKYTKTYNRLLFNEGELFNKIYQTMLRKNSLVNTGINLSESGPLFKLMNVTLEGENGNRIFENISLTIQPTDRIVLLGDNGIGKTTLMKLLFKSQSTFRNNPVYNQIRSLDRKLLNESINNNTIQKGSKMWELFERINEVNRNMTNTQQALYNVDDIESRIMISEPFNFKLVDGLMSISEAKISYYPQNCSNILNYKKTVYNLVKDYSGKEIETQLLEEYMRCFHLGDYMDSYVSDLSFGERSRLLLSLLLVNKAHYLLLDEPTNHLDVLMKKLLKLILNNIYKGGFLIATHDLDLIQELETINAFMYIYSRDKVFKFNEKFREEYIKFKSEYPDATRAKLLEFLNKCSLDTSLSKINRSIFAEELNEPKKIFKKKKKTPPPANPNDRSKFKNIKRWK